MHVEPWRRSGLGIRKYCRWQRLPEKHLSAWLKQLAAKTPHVNSRNYQTELGHEKRREEANKNVTKAKAATVFVSTDIRNRTTLAFWAMHVEAMNWSGMGVRAYAAATQLWPHPLRNWRDRLATGEVAIDGRASSPLRPPGR